MRNYGSKEKLRNYIQNGATTKNWSRSNAFFSCDTCFFPAMHVSKGFGPDTAPIRPRHGPDTSPIRPPKCIFPKIQPPKAGIFWKNRNYKEKELIGAIRGEESWTDLSWFVLLLRTLRDRKMVGLCENEKVRNQTSWRYFFDAMPPSIRKKSSMKTTALVLR